MEIKAWPEDMWRVFLCVCVLFSSQIKKENRARGARRGEGREGGGRRGPLEDERFLFVLKAVCWSLTQSLRGYGQIENAWV